MPASVWLFGYRIYLRYCVCTSYMGCEEKGRGKIPIDWIEKAARNQSDRGRAWVGHGLSYFGCARCNFGKLWLILPRSIEIIIK